MLSAKKYKNRERKMRLGEHLVELRKRIIVCAITIVLAAIGGWFLADYIWDILRAPINVIASETERIAYIAFTDVTGSFDLKMRVAFLIAVFAASPVWLYQVWAFFAPGLYRREKIAAIGFLSASVPLFLFGAGVAWWVLPNIVRLMTSFSSPEDALLLNAREYLSFASTLMFAVGIGFVLPVFIVLLNFLGVLSGKTVLKSWRLAVLLIVFFAAVTTPAAEVLSMLWICCRILRTV